MYGCPEIPLEISFDWLFDRVNQEDVYEKYLGFCGLNEKFTNPLRDDRKGGCSFYWNGGVLFFKDFAINKTYTCVSVVMESERLSYYDALWKIYNVFYKRDTVNKKPVTKKIDSIKTYRTFKVKVQLFNHIGINYCKSFGITGGFIKRAKWYYIEKIWDEADRLIYYYRDEDPCIGYYFGDDKWKFYFFKRKDYRFMGNVPQDVLQGEHMLPEKAEYIIITKSFKDVGTLDKFGIVAVAPQAESVILTENQMNRLRKVSQNIFTLSDYDNTGIHFGWQMRKLYNTKPLFLTEKLWARKKGYLDAKDISDFYHLYGENETKKLIKTNEKYNSFSSIEE
jgi:5S rRNA maturation endonuclease (ribonuclease M5)